MKRHLKASHASATPATDGTYVVALFGSEGLYCYDVSGRLLWKQDLGVMNTGMVGDEGVQWGPASSPIIHGPLVIVQNDRQRESFLAAYELKSGEQVWKVERDEFPSWATPLVVTDRRTFRAGGQRLEVHPRLRSDDRPGAVAAARRGDAGEGVLAGGRAGMAIVTGGYPRGSRPIYAIKPQQQGRSTRLRPRDSRGAPSAARPTCRRRWSTAT